MKNPPLQRRLAVLWLLSFGILGVSFLGACSTPGSSIPSAFPSATQEVTLAVPNTTHTPSVTRVPTYIVYAQRVEATARAIALTLPTASPVPGLHPDKQASLQASDLWERALKTAIALYPPPPGYDPRTERTRVPPQPTEVPPPHRTTANGTIYDASSEDSPTGNLIRTQNYWRGRIGGQDAWIYAGYTKDTPAQGVIIVMVRLPPGSQSTRQTDMYLAPIQTEGLRLMDEVGGQLTLQAGDGTLIYFNLLTRQWIIPTPSPVPSPLQSPLPSPSAGP